MKAEGLRRIVASRWSRELDGIDDDGECLAFVIRDHSLLISWSVTRDDLDSDTDTDRYFDIGVPA